MGVRVPRRKNGLRLPAPLARARRPRAMSFATASVVATGVGRTCPLTESVLTTMRLWPNDACSGDAWSRQLWTRPAYAILGLRGVLAIGVLQQLAYQRSRPPS